MSNVVVLGDPDNQTRLSRTLGGFALSRATGADGVLLHLTDKQTLQLVEFVLKEYAELMPAVGRSNRE